MIGLGPSTPIYVCQLIVEMLETDWVVFPLVRPEVDAARVYLRSGALERESEARAVGPFSARPSDEFRSRGTIFEGSAPISNGQLP